MPFFFTGEIQIGKSTALRRALAASGRKAGGIMTRFVSGNGERKLCLLPYEAEFSPSTSLPESAVCARMDASGRHPFPEVFDTVGVSLLEAAAADPKTELLVIDELGFLEAEAQKFRAAVWKVLSGTKPVIGVVRQGLGAWTDAPFGNLYTVTHENRDAAPAALLEWLDSL